MAILWYAEAAFISFKRLAWQRLKILTPEHPSPHFWHSDLNHVITFNS